MGYISPIWEEQTPLKQFWSNIYVANEVMCANIPAKIFKGYDFFKGSNF